MTGALHLQSQNSSSKPKNIDSQAAVRGISHLVPATFDQTSQVCGLQIYAAAKDTLLKFCARGARLVAGRDTAVGIVILLFYAFGDSGGINAAIAGGCVGVFGRGQSGQKAQDRYVSRKLHLFPSGGNNLMMKVWELDRTFDDSSEDHLGKRANKHSYQAIELGVPFQRRCASLDSVSLNGLNTQAAI
jgi:hypothetical protein